MRLFHFSEDAHIAQFVPRPVRQAAPRPPGQQWLNGPLVWAIHEDHQRLYLFPRDCPRIVIWARSDSSADDRHAWLSDLQPGAQAVAYIERAWAARVAAATIWRYDLPTEHFQSLEDAGMYVSRQPARPLSVERLTDLPQVLSSTGTELRIVDSLLPLRDVWASSLHASGIRLRHAAGWP